MDPSQEKKNIFGEAWKWWMSIDKDTRLNNTSEEFEKKISDKWIRDTKMEATSRIQNELKEAK